MNVAAIETEAKVIAAKFVTEYGVVTRAIVAHPKTAAIVVFILGAVLGHVL
jgi:hypothetical protein